MRFQIFEGEKNRKYSFLYVSSPRWFSKTPSQKMAFRGTKDDLSDYKKPSFGLQKGINGLDKYHQSVIVLYVLN